LILLFFERFGVFYILKNNLCSFYLYLICFEFIREVSNIRQIRLWLLFDGWYFIFFSTYHIMDHFWFHYILKMLVCWPLLLSTFYWFQDFKIPLKLPSAESYWLFCNTITLVPGKILCKKKNDCKII